MAAPAGLPLRAELRGLVPYGAPQVDVPVRLNVNENPYPPSDLVVADIAAAVAGAAHTLNRYPDREAVQLRTALAGYLGHHLTSDNVWVANGSNELMLHLLQAFGGPRGKALVFEPTYSMYPEYARTSLTPLVTGNRAEDFTVDMTGAVELVRAEQPTVVLLTSPNNPTGTALDLETVAAICDAATGVVVVDEAYAEFRRDGTASALRLCSAYRHLVVTRTMSKAFALAGARLGYLAADRAVVDSLRVVRLPYHLSSVTQAVALTALRHRGELLGRVDELRRERDATVQWLRGNGLAVAETDANFVMFGQFEDRHRVWQGLLGRGVLIRETGPDGWLRVSIGTTEEMTSFRAALLEVLGT